MVEYCQKKIINITWKVAPQVLTVFEEHNCAEHDSIEVVNGSQYFMERQR